jgi:hypothetical protein
VCSQGHSTARTLGKGNLATIGVGRLFLNLRRKWIFSFISAMHRHTMEINK